MAIVSTDLLIKLSTTAGAAGNANTSTPNASLGKYISTTQVVDATLNNLFDDVTGDENAANDVEYRCFFIHNNHATLSLQNAVVWITADVSGGANVGIGVDPAAATVIGSTPAQAAVSTDENSAPSPTVTFTNYASGSAVDTKARGLSVGTIAAGSCRAIWVRRTAANTAALNSDGCTIRIEGDTAA